MMPGLLENWLALGFLAAGAWATCCIVDVCFVGRRIFQRPWEPVVVAGLFGVLPLPLLVQDVSFDPADLAGPGAVTAVLSGGCYLLHLQFYFRALFSRNDASSAEIFNTLCVLFVPLLAFLVLDERLPGRQYLALTLAIGGVVVLAGRQFGRSGGRTARALVCSVIFLSITMVLQARAYQELNFATGSFLFLTCMFLAALTMTLSSGLRRRRIRELCLRLGPIFAITGLIDVAAVIGTQRATEVAPSVSLVALVGCALPLFVICFSAVALAVARRRLPTDVSTSLALQTRDWSRKLISLGMIGGAIALVTWPSLPDVTHRTSGEQAGSSCSAWRVSCRWNDAQVLASSAAIHLPTGGRACTSRAPPSSAPSTRGNRSDPGNARLLVDNLDGLLNQSDVPAFASTETNPP